MTIRTLFFGHYRDIITSGEQSIILDHSNPSVADAAEALAQLNPRLADLLTKTRVAIGTEFATPETKLKDNDELAFLPPMSGG
jgi:sulfur-carrier protein